MGWKAYVVCASIPGCSLATAGYGAEDSDWSSEYAASPFIFLDSVCFATPIMEGKPYYYILKEF